ncbi:MAG TPA: RHS repeat protein, partial [Arcobacter sp.]|nr:RHS repeat protein [Arcobacter sp.]
MILNQDSNNTYTTKISEYSKIVKNNNASDGFTVYSKNGNITQYLPFNSIYLRTKITNRFNQSINYNYNKSNAETYLLNIQYANNQVNFTYETKKDTVVSYDENEIIIFSQRIKTIDILSDNKKLFTYNLKYAHQDSKIDVSRLINITKCVDKECLEPLEITWGSGEDNLNIVSINDSFDNTTNISYTSYKDGNTSKRVVQNIQGENIDISYSYENLKNGVFEKVSTINNINNLKTTDEYKSNYPFVGFKYATKSYIDDELISNTSTEYSSSIYNNIYKIQTPKRTISSYVNGTLVSTNTIKNISYDEYGNILESTNTLIDETSNKEFVKTIVNKYSNDTSNWQINKLINTQTTTISPTNTKVNTIAYTYDDSTGALQSKIVEPNDTKAITQSYIYDIYGNILSQTISSLVQEDIKTSYSYDTLGKFFLQETNALGHISSNTYNAFGYVLSNTNSNGLKTTYEYGIFGNKIKEIQINGVVTTYDYIFENTYGAFYKVITKQNGLFPKTTYINKQNQIIKTITLNFKGEEVYVDTFYDKQGNIIKQSLPYDSTQTPTYILVSYDKYNRIIKKQRQIDNTLETIETISYDILSTSTTNANNQVKTTIFNIHGNPLKVIEELDTSISYEYDALNQLIKTIDSKNNEIVLRYDIFGNKIYQDDPDMGIYTYEYNIFNQIIKQTNSANQITTYTYDKLQRKISQNISGDISTWKYDTSKLGLLNSEEKENYKRVYVYDSLSRLKETTTTIDNNTFTKSFTYDSLGRLDTKTLPNNFNITNEYGYLSAVKSPKSQIGDFNEGYLDELLLNGIASSDIKASDYSISELDVLKKEKEKEILIDDVLNKISSVKTKYERLERTYLCAYSRILELINNTEDSLNKGRYIEQSKNFIHTYTHNGRMVRIINEVIENENYGLLLGQNIFNEYESMINDKIFRILEIEDIFKNNIKRNNSYITNQINIKKRTLKASQYFKLASVYIEYFWKISYYKSKSQNLEEFREYMKTALQNSENAINHYNKVIARYTESIKNIKDDDEKKKLFQKRKAYEEYRLKGYEKSYSKVFVINQILSEEVRNNDSINLFNSNRHVIIEKYTKKAKDFNLETNQLLEELYSDVSNTESIAEALKPTYQTMIDNNNYNYFYKVISQDNQNRITSYTSSNGLVTNNDYSSLGVLRETSTGFTQENTIRKLTYEYDDLDNVTYRKDHNLNVTQNFTYDNLNRITKAYTDTANSSDTMEYRYDTLGNIIYKSDIGIYTYSSTSPHQVIKAGNKTFTYDILGNMIKNNNQTLTY